MFSIMSFLLFLIVKALSTNESSALWNFVKSSRQLYPEVLALAHSDGHIHADWGQLQPAASTIHKAIVICSLFTAEKRGKSFVQYTILAQLHNL